MDFKKLQIRALKNSKTYLYSGEIFFQINALKKTQKFNFTEVKLSFHCLICNRSLLLYIFNVIYHSVHSMIIRST